MDSKNNCLLCGAELIYFEEPRTMECAVCHKRFPANAACKNGHYICDRCHMRCGAEVAAEYCRRTDSATPIASCRRSARALHPLCTAGAPRPCRRGAAGRLPHSGGALARPRAARDGAQGQAGAGRRLRVLGLLRRGGERRDRRQHPFGRDPAVRGAVGPLQRRDGGGAGRDRRPRRAALLQARFVCRRPRRRSVHPGAFRGEIGDAGAQSSAASAAQ